MMGVLRSMTGTVRLSLTSADLAGALSAINQAGIRVFETAQTDGLTATLTIYRADYPALKSIAQRRGERLQLRQRQGIYWTVKGLLHRPVLVLGLALLLGLVLFLVLGLFLRDLGRVRKSRWCMAAAAMGLLGITLVLGNAKYGAVNWISIGGLSFQPSEIAKICYIFAGSATLERLLHKRNITLFILLTGVCIGLLGLMSDFGTAAIFFVTFLVIAYLRSGDWATLTLICGGAVFGAGIIVTFKPYILSRFASWGHAWEAASTTGYQQTRTMSAAASGGLLGMGGGNGWLHRIPAADTDLVFGMLCEEWGLLIAVLAVVSIITLAVFAVRACRVGRSSYYIIAACAAGSLLVFQTCLNVFGSVDLLPLTGVTFPFVSNGGSAMMSAWGLLAFLKATDTRENASFAIQRKPQRQLTEQARRMAEAVDDPFGEEEEVDHEED